MKWGRGLFPPMELLQIELMFGWMWGGVGSLVDRRHCYIVLYGDSFDGRRRRGLRREKQDKKSLWRYRILELFQWLYLHVLCNHLGCGIPLLYTFRAATSGRISIDSLAKSVFAMIASSAISSDSASNSSCCTDSASNVSSNRASSVMVKSSKRLDC